METVEQCSSSYTEGCRCQGCRDHHALVARLKRKRKQSGKEWYSDHLPIAPARDAVRRMKHSGLTWDQIAAVVGTDRRSIQRTGKGDRIFITRHLMERIERAEQLLAREPEPEMVAAVLVPRDRARWMVGALMAVGWTSEWIGDRVGWSTGCSYGDFRNPKVHVETVARIEKVFLEYHYQWGPSRVTAVGSWRKGRFPADCYNWDQSVPDYRPIPGSLHPDLVVEASTFNPVNRSRTKQVLEDMQRWGQWPSERCARTSMRSWVLSQGLPLDECEDKVTHRSRSVWCGIPHHDHGLPVLWEV